MPDMAVDDEGMQLDLVASSLRADTADVGAYVEGLAVKLEGALAGRVVVDRGRRGLRGPKVVRKISVEAGGDRLELVCGDRDRVECKRARVSGGIVLKNETMDIDAWTAALSQALVDEAGKNERARQALERLLLG
jgi:hypothetical protein